MSASVETSENAALSPGTIHHWVMTVQADDGRQGTTDGVINVVPGVHTREATYSEVLRAVKQWIGSDSVTVLYFALQPNQL
ncbi:hypothetical protein ABZ725_14320 [Streptomyces sp. NPDC006872]|uniref:hypothetical protein n=1 Tax=Streptomyces sp. NPDC006872 TaxID=3155720 RepID=UPI0034074BA3